MDNYTNTLVLATKKICIYKQCTDTGWRLDVFPSSIGTDSKKKESNDMCCLFDDDDDDDDWYHCFKDSIIQILTLKSYAHLKTLWYS